MGPVKTLLSAITNCCSQVFNDYNSYQTLTYYVPAPPSRSTSYREKKFDHFCQFFLNKGFKIISFTTTLHQSESQNGFWAIFVLQAMTKEARQLDIDAEAPVLTEELSLIHISEPTRPY